MPKKQPALRLRPVDGLLEDLSLSIPEGWMGVLRAQSVKLGISVEAMITQYVGHLAAEREKMTRPPEAGDDAARLVLRDGLRESYRRESARTGISLRSLLNRAVQAGADYFDGRSYEATPEPVKLVPRLKSGSKT